MVNQDFAAISLDIRRERAEKLIGTVYIRIKHLHFLNVDKLRSHVDPKSTRRVKRIYREEENIRSGDALNHIPALIDGVALAQFLTLQNLCIDHLRGASTVPKLELPDGFRVQCLSGRHRIAAAEEEAGQDKWWAVDLFRTDMSEVLREFLVNEYSNERKPSDGELFFSTRMSKVARCTSQWLARLASVSNSPNRLRNYKALLSDEEYLARFDRFLRMEALLHGMKLTTLNKVRAKRYRTELLHALDYVCDFWETLLLGRTELMAKLDVDTVIRLEKSSPGACADDHEALRRQIEEKRVFSNFSTEERQAIWSRLCVLTKDRLVPSLGTFFDNVSYLENAGNAMELLVDVGKKGDLRSALAAAFPKDRRNVQNCMVQVSALEFQSAKIHGGCQFGAAYLQLWLYAIRECQDIDKAGTSDKAVEVILHEFALVAAKLGFRTGKINSLLKDDPDLIMARRFLTAARPADEYQYDSLEQHAMEIKGLLSTALPMQARIERDDC